MSFFKNILPAVLIFGVFSSMFSQSTYCPEKMLLLQKYKSKAYENALGYIDTVLSQCPNQVQDPYFWHVCGFINLDLFKFVENKTSKSITKEKAAECFIKSINLDVEKKYFDLNNKLLDYISTFYYNDAVKILQKFDMKNQDNAISYYNSFKNLKGIAHPDYDFNDKDLDFYFGIGMLYKMRYENDKTYNKSLLDSCINYFNKSLEIDPDQYSANYNLGIMYHNLGVDIIMEELDIDADLEMVILMQEKAVNYFSKSLPFLKKVYQMKPQETSIVQGIAAVYYSLNDMEKHVEYMNILKELESNSGE
jgi:tetratricopeptide (TPR) repeat protein